MYVYIRTVYMCSIYLLNDRDPFYNSTNEREENSHNVNLHNDYIDQKTIIYYTKM